MSLCHQNMQKQKDNQKTYMFKPYTQKAQTKKTRTQKNRQKTFALQASSRSLVALRRRWFRGDHRRGRSRPGR